VHRKVRDVAITTVVLLILAGSLLSISPALRERVGLVATGKSEIVPHQVVSKAMTSTGATAMWYANNNTYLVGFLIVAACLFILMLRA